MKTFGRITTLFMTMALAGFAQAQSSTSAEFQCRTKAKELAAETYKGCMTENRQVQLEQIRKDYKEKLGELKAHYDKELKKMSGSQMASNTTPKTGPTKSTTKSQRAARIKPSSQTQSANLPTSLPAKKMAVRSQAIDFATPPDTTELDSIEPSQSENRLKIEQDDSSDVEVVELPSQE